MEQDDDKGRDDDSDTWNSDSGSEEEESSDDDPDTAARRWMERVDRPLVRAKWVVEHRLKHPQRLTVFERGWEENEGAGGVDTLVEVDLGYLEYRDDEDREAVTQLLNQCLRVKEVWMWYSVFQGGTRLPAFPESCHARLEEVWMEVCEGLESGEQMEPLAQLYNLRVLWMYGCKLTEVPRFVGNLNKLEVLNLSGNNIQVFPLELVEWLVTHSHTKVDLYRNPLRVPPEEVWHQGPGAVKKYYDSLTQSSELSLHISLVTLGEVCAGKTSLTRALVGESM